MEIRGETQSHRNGVKQTKTYFHFETSRIVESDLISDRNKRFIRIQRNRYAISHASIASLIQVFIEL